MSEISAKLTISFSNGHFQYSPDFFVYNNYKKHLNLDKLSISLGYLRKVESFQKYLYNMIIKKGFNFFSYSQLIHSTRNIGNIEKHEFIPYIRIGIMKKDVSLFREIPISVDLKSDISVITKELLNDISGIQGTSNLKEDTYDIVFSSSASSYLIHEILGHLLEKDYSNLILKNVKVGDLILNENLTLKDDPFYSSFINFGQCDDSGKIYKTTTLIKNGNLCNFIENVRVADIRDKQLNRMTNLILINENKLTTVEKTNYIYVDHVYHGFIDYSLGVFHLFSTIAKKVESGKVVMNFKNVIISGYIYDLIKKLQVYNDIVYYSLGNCIKKNQMIITGMASPSLYVNNLNARSIYDK